MNKINKDLLLKEYKKVRNKSLNLISDLGEEDMTVQTENFVSPIKWHLAHTTWFFEKFFCEKYIKNYKLFNENFSFLFNSYYNSSGNFLKKENRGQLNRPFFKEIINYRIDVDKRVCDFLLDFSFKREEQLNLIKVGLNHEQQHQELMLMDILNIFYNNPLKPKYQLKKDNFNFNSKKTNFEWLNFDLQKINIGYEGYDFCFDNELPSHSKEISPFSLSKDLVMNYQWKEFINDNGYSRPELWLSDGFDFIKRNKIDKPMYWIDHNYNFTLNGVQKIIENAPVCHVSFYEADAFARWKRKRLPSEFELELILKNNPIEGNFMESGLFQTIPEEKKNNYNINKIFGDVWEWTSSHYDGYKGYKPWLNSLTEYNSKFMCNQFVLKGGSCATPKTHIRSTYRNFYYPSDRWHFCGFRLAE